ncbi:hypothetical protein AB685_00415 [Bacillus sp. LL01]|uniref:hypothetical protein n=1 Tax=Bacillus sp. LL01 TaxID=1665556 RepID=UPI00064D5ED6|nr:hypothetical protein [Bacillus sp. LL01]KMJ59390.1 hypothetical protein AB685_00415 [Bacillus sp. LL01]
MNREFLTDGYYRTLVETYREVINTYEKLNAILSALDKEISRLYHQLELCPVEELDSILFTSQLKDVLAKRRAIKDEKARISPFYQLAQEAVDEIEKRHRRTISRTLKNQIKSPYTAWDVAEELGVLI